MVTRDSSSSVGGPERGGVSRFRRRTVLASTAGLVGLAGCSGDDETPTETPTDEPERTVEDIEGLQLWLHPDGDTQHGEGGISAWRDDSDNGNDLTQSTQSRQPSVLEDAVDGKRAVQFDGEDDYLLREDTLGIADDSARTHVVVSRLTDPTVRAPFLMQGLFDSSDSGSSYYGLEANTFRTTGERFGLYLVSVAKDSEQSTDTDYHVHVLRTMKFPALDAIEESTTYHIDGQQVPFGDTPGGTRNSPFEGNSTAIGGFPVSDPGALLTGEIAEVRVYDRAVTADERSLLEDHLSEKYGLGSG